MCHHFQSLNKSFKGSSTVFVDCFLTIVEDFDENADGFEDEAEKKIKNLIAIQDKIDFSYILVSS
jgi:adenosyl cobinamide kinase/adenosyl cobinamide phosphate guanylyltransferase